MRDFLLQLNRREFEYDLYSLIRAFYPGAEIRICYEGDETREGGADGTYVVRYGEHDVRFLHEGTEDVRAARGEGPITSWDDRPGTKNEVKQVVYQALARETGRELPWGDLCGIRPTKLTMRLLEEGKSEEEAARVMRGKYFVSGEKAALTAEIASREKKILGGIDTERGYSLYVGVPYCPSICLYCSFGSHPLDRFADTVEPYLTALEKEMRFVSEAMRGRHLDTIYIGGGTPTSLSAEQLRRLLGMLERYFSADSALEFTIEAGRPDTITEEKLRVLREFPVSRISINPQTMNQKTLDLIGRKHTVEQTEETFLAARGMGFSNINMDLIVGLPGEGRGEVARTLEEVEKLAPDSLTVHSLALKRATRLNLFRDEYVPVSFENSGAIMDDTRAAADAMDLHPYYLYRQKNMAGNFENVGYAREGLECLYNILIMEEKETVIAVGSHASTKLVFDGARRIERVENVKDVKSYIDRVDEMIGRKRNGIGTYLADCRENLFHEERNGADGTDGHQGQKNSI